VRQLLAVIALRPAAPAAPAGDADADLLPEARALVAAGGRVFASVCAACHQLDGRGMAGLAPPLRDSEWVTGEPSRLIRIALHGLRGPVRAGGQAFDGEMPGQSWLGDQDLAAALSYLRRAFGHRESAIDAAAVAAVRAQHAARAEPWTAAALAPGH
jgi:mono/diheme cytochrome c family protein